MKKDIAYLHAQKRARRPIAALTAYDHPTAMLEDQAGIDLILVGDSLGAAVLGYESAAEVTMDDMVHHLKAVRRGVAGAYLMADMPAGSHETPELALANAGRFLECGADGVKLEGWAEKAPVVEALTRRGIQVCAHIGYNQQYHGVRGRIQGRSFEAARSLVEGARALQAAGAVLVVLELMPEPLARRITELLAIPTIGIGSGRFCDGQVLVVDDLLGITPRQFRHARKYVDLRSEIACALARFQEDVEAGRFPGEENTTRMPPEELARLEEWLSGE